MRITKVRFRNLNSLVGEWEVDLTAPDFTADGIFAIIGPTGAGKTTILDAICLALYGRTPRLEKVNKSGNEIMSRQSGECFAEVEFSTVQGNFRSHWSQHRARRRPDGELQPAKHEVSDMDTGKPLGEKLRDSAEEVARVTGMDFDRFTRSMLLAQGAFAAFLNAPADERASILQEITGTAIYSDISKHVHQLFVAETKELEAAQIELQGIAVLSEGDEQQLRDDVAEAGHAARRHEATMADLKAAIDWLQLLDKLAKQLDNVAEQEVALAAEESEFEPRRVQLLRAKAALELDADYVDLRGLRISQGEDEERLEASRNQVKGKQGAVEDADAEVKTVRASVRRAGQAKEEAAPTIRAARELDTVIVEKRKPIADGETKLSRQCEELEALEREVSVAQVELAAQQGVLATLHEELERTSGDRALVGSYAGIEVQLRALESLRFDLERTRGELADARESATGASTASAEAQDAASTRQAVADEAKQVLDAAQVALAETLAGRTLAELRAQRDHLVQRSEGVEAAAEAAKGVAAANGELATLADRVLALTAKRKEGEEEQRALADRETTLSDELVRLEERVRLLTQIGLLDEARRELRDGHECPLCGSLDHPYARGNVPEPSEAQRELKAARKAFEGVREERLRIAHELASLEREGTQIADRREAAESEQVESLETLRSLCRHLELGIPHDAQAADALLDTLAGMRGEVRQRLETSAATITVAEGIDESIKNAYDALGRASAALNEANQTADAATYEAKQATTEVTRLETDLGDREAEYAEKFAQLAGSLADYQIQLGDADEPLDFEVVADGLRQRRDSWQQRELQERELGQTVSDLKAAVQTLAAAIAGKQSDISESKRHLADLQDDLRATCGRRRELFGEKDPNTEEERLAAGLESAEAELKTAEATAAKAHTELEQLEQRIRDLTSTIAQRAEVLSAQEAAFTQLLAASEFDGEADYQAASMPSVERVSLEARDRELSERRTKLDTLRNQTLQALESERVKAITSASVDELQPQLEEAQAAKSQAEQEVGRLGQRLADNDSAKRATIGARERLAVRELEHRRWSDLHALVGSGDGKRYRNFAQGLTFEIMINHANRQLQRMTDRYLLIHDDANPLQLSVVDDYQAGEVRSTKNLSGGEGFIVSLALALGLSQMASRNVRVDSLFLDEGFGTLDEEALENALTTLSSLQQDGKMIGIISHVGALKERISARIVVTPDGAGRSLLSGPGCRGV